MSERGPSGTGHDTAPGSPSAAPDEDECATCYHGVSLHNWTDGCEVPDCDCEEFIQPEQDDE